MLQCKFLNNCTIWDLKLCIAILIRFLKMSVFVFLIMLTHFFVLGLQLHTDSPLLLNPLYFSCWFGCLQLFYLFCSSIFSFYWPVFQLSNMSFSVWNLLLKSSHKFFNSNIWFYNSGRNICFMFRDFNFLVNIFIF